MSLQVDVFLIAKVGHALRLIKLGRACESLFDLSHMRNSLVLSLLEPVFSVLHFELKLVSHIFHEVLALV